MAILIAILGTIYVFRSNGGASGEDFLGRFFSIGFVMTIRFLTILIPLTVALTFYYMAEFPEGETIVTTPLDIAFFNIWYGCLFWRIGKHITDLQNKA
ncbi:MAG: hypothetical protein ACR2PX_29140 [Endozoicomonas sp.]|uniref:hypothetical protein n=1 Tax=Endozoicomonas sp. TaxID=1892382 RepID=UPI003D9AC309